MRLLIVDDHAAFRAMVRTMLELAGIEIVGEASDSASAVAAAEALRPSVVLLDIGLPDGNGFDVCERITGAGEPPAVILTSSRDASSYADRLTTTSARGFIPKQRLSAEAIAELAEP